jgi:hypothetical protein
MASAVSYPEETFVPLANFETFVINGTLDKLLPIRLPPQKTPCKNHRMSPLTAFSPSPRRNSQ